MANFIKQKYFLNDYLSGIKTETILENVFCGTQNRGILIPWSILPPPMILPRLHAWFNRPLRAKGNFIRFRALFRGCHQFLRLYRVGGRFNK
jgi:hypothetical protein